MWDFYSLKPLPWDNSIVKAIAYDNHSTAALPDVKARTSKQTCTRVQCAKFGNFASRSCPPMASHASTSFTIHIDPVPVLVVALNPDLDLNPDSSSDVDSAAPTPIPLQLLVAVPLSSPIPILRSPVSYESI
ncbi:hypothetical protein EVAR_85993_1 [Eumeta japonica]|uniref:Uncharacterized protein n=1 Tax=Eumeta variegata TaxID=151549 RepID=A0A4C1UJ36_EUMVA|nr:hypothetical protein EVAR_85993_1 [Eumeta japonica]